MWVQALTEAQKRDPFLLFGVNTAQDSPVLISPLCAQHVLGPVSTCNILCPPKVYNKQHILAIYRTIYFTILYIGALLVSVRVLECVYACTRTHAGVCMCVCVVVRCCCWWCGQYIMLVDVMSVLSFAYVCTLTAFQDTFLGEQRIWTWILIAEWPVLISDPMSKPLSHRAWRTTHQSRAYRLSASVEWSM